jgi:hypothetical protein
VQRQAVLSVRATRHAPQQHAMQRTCTIESSPAWSAVAVGAAGRLACVVAVQRAAVQARRVADSERVGALCARVKAWRDVKASRQRSLQAAHTRCAAGAPVCTSAAAWRARQHAAAASSNAARPRRRRCMLAPLPARQAARRSRRVAGGKRGGAELGVRGRGCQTCRRRAGQARR